MRLKSVTVQPCSQGQWRPHHHAEELQLNTKYCPLFFKFHFLSQQKGEALLSCFNIQVRELQKTSAYLLKTIISCPSLCIFTKCIDLKKKTLLEFQSENYDFSRFLLLRGYFGKALRCIALNDFPSKENFLYLEVQSVLNLFWVSRLLEENITLLGVPSYSKSTALKMELKVLFFSVSV